MREVDGPAGARHCAEGAVEFPRPGVADGTIDREVHATRDGRNFSQRVSQGFRFGREQRLGRLRGKGCVQRHDGRSRHQEILQCLHLLFFLFVAVVAAGCCPFDLCYAAAGEIPQTSSASATAAFRERQWRKVPRASGKLLTKGSLRKDQRGGYSFAT